MNKLPTILIVGLLVPQTIFAAWWNPFSWNWKSFFTPALEVEKDMTEIVDTPTVISESNKDKDISPKDVTLTQVTKPQVATVQPVASSQGIQNVQVQASQNVTNISWQTQEAAESKVFVFKDGILEESKPSIHGLSTRHDVTILGTFLRNKYSYEIESVYNSGKAAKYSGVIIATPTLIFEKENNSNYIVIKNNGLNRLEVKKLVFKKTDNERLYNLLSPTSSKIIQLDSNYIEPSSFIRVFVPRFEDYYSSLEYEYGSIIDTKTKLDVEFERFLF